MNPLLFVVLKWFIILAIGYSLFGILGGTEQKGIIQIIMAVVSFLVTIFIVGKIREIVGA